VSEPSNGILDKAGVFARHEPLRLDLGCGQGKRGPDYVGVDLLDTPSVDIVGDVLDVLRQLEDERVTEVYSSHLFEHVADLSALVDELERVLVVRGRLHVVVPHFSNPYYYSDPTHERPFGLYTFSYFAEDPILRRRVPTYGRALRLRLETARLGFRSEAEFPGRRKLKAAVNRLVNTNVWLQEFYEENLPGLMPCYELEFELVKVR
jgi:ubiquinone/menaquinone biosynthesis C-methylase UbiE